MSTITTEVPVVELSSYRAGVRGARDSVAAALGEALRTVGFVSFVGHGVDWSLIEEIYDWAARYHGLAAEAKADHLLSGTTMGYNPIGGESHADGRPSSLNAAFFMARPGSSRNLWPREEVLPGFRQACERYYLAMDRFCHGWLLPLYAVAFGMEPTYFQERFDPSLATLRLSHYPPLPAAEGQWGIDPHTDAGFMTLLPSNPVDGLWIKPDVPAGPGWFAVRQEPQSFVVNAGDMLRRWTNDRSLSTVHRALNQSPVDRYAIPFFYDPRVDSMVQCLPSCTDVNDPPHYEPVRYGDYLRAFMRRNYAPVRGESRAGRPGGSVQLRAQGRPLVPIVAEDKRGPRGLHGP